MSSAAPNAIANTADFEFSALWEAHNYRAYIIEEFGRFLTGHVLEVGCGIGQMTEEFKNLKSIEKLTCIEPDAAFAAQHRSSLPGTTLIEGTVEALPGGTKADAIVSINVLEHIGDDTDELARYHGLLSSPRSHLCLLVPAGPEIFAPIDSDFGHFRRYTKAELASKLENAGFRIEHIFHYNSTGYFAWLLGFKILKARKFNIAQVRLYDRLIFPIVHWLESRVARPPFGQSLVAIASPRA